MKKSTNRNGAGGKGDNKEYGDAQEMDDDTEDKPIAVETLRCCHCRRGFHPSIIVDHKKHCNVWYCRHCGAKMLQTEKDAQFKACGPPSRQECTGCRKLFPRGEIEAHRKDCKMWRCRCCGKIMPLEHKEIHLEVWEADLLLCRAMPEQIPEPKPPQPRRKCYKCHKKVSQVEEHWKVCEYFQCYRCQASWPVAEQDDHSKSCAKTLPSWCDGCHRYMPASEIKEHKKACNTQTCPQYNKAGTKEQIEAHLKECSRKRCSLCRRVIEIDGGHDCPNSRCSLCLRDFPKGTEDLHLAQCTGPKLKDWVSSRESDSLPSCYCQWKRQMDCSSHHY
jgi:hypothetical protein